MQLPGSVWTWDLTREMAGSWPKKLGNVQVGFLRCEGILDGEECKGIAVLVLCCGAEYPSLLLTRRR